MKINQDLAISTSRLLLVPYERRHVPRYHEWMQDPAILEATASERLELEEEFENQESWRASPNKLTFIICKPLTGHQTSEQSVTAGAVDGPGDMIGDINFFLTPLDNDFDDCDNDDLPPPRGDSPQQAERDCVGEVDIMIAESLHRGKGLGRATVAAFLYYILSNLEPILCEYYAVEDGLEKANKTYTRLKRLVAKIKEGNAHSIALFKSLGFAQKGAANYFGEIEMVLSDLASLTTTTPNSYSELVYSR